MEKQAKKKQQTIPTVSNALSDGTLIELIYIKEENRTAFAVWKDGNWSFERKVESGPNRRYVPYSPDNNLIKHNVVLFPSRATEYGSEKELTKEVRKFIHRYVDVSKGFENIAAYYVLFTWLHDNFNELPYLRLRGDYGTGKTRFLQTVGSLCYRPIFASGASTISPIFHMLDMLGGTLIIDEADFRFSDETADMVKILNNGNVKGMPVLRSQMMRGQQYNPKVFNVFGPKIVATRGHYDDRALESRFITEEMGKEPLREDIPINLPPIYQEEALALRNKLLMYRFRNYGKFEPSESLVDRSIEPRLNQVFVPLLSIIDNKKMQKELKRIAKSYHSDHAAKHSIDDTNDIVW